jgi:hypothetical protein
VTKPPSCSLGLLGRDLSEKQCSETTGEFFLLMATRSSPLKAHGARVKEYSAPVPAAADLLHLNIEFELQASESRKRTLDLWIEDAPDITLVAESVGMLEAIKRWLDGSKGDDELMYDSGLRELIPRRPSRQ